MICSRCGNRITGNSTFCTSCGAPLNSSNPFDQYDDPFGQPGNPYGQPGSPYGGRSYGKAPIKKRSVVLCLLLDLITCDLYSWVWMYHATNDLKTASGDSSALSGDKVILYNVLTLRIYSWIWMYKAGEQISAAKQRYLGQYSGSNGVLYLVLCLLGLGVVSFALIQHELNKLASY